MKKIIVGFAAALLVAYVVAAPYITVHHMKVAAENRDGEALSEYIDFPSVRQSIKDQLNAEFAKTLEDDAMKDNPFSAMGAAFAGAMVDQMVDAYVTPAGITQLMAGEKPQSENEGERSSGSNTPPEPFENVSMSYEALDKFVVSIGEGEDVGKFVLRRRGLGWQLTDVIIPL